jgi:hypothetical protein
MIKIFEDFNAIPKYHDYVIIGNIHGFNNKLRKFASKNIGRIISKIY